MANDLHLLGNKAIRIHPSTEMHTKIEKVQSFLHLTGKGELTKEQISLMLMAEGVKVYEKQMSKFI